MIQMWRLNWIVFVGRRLVALRAKMEKTDIQFAMEQLECEGWRIE